MSIANYLRTLSVPGRNDFFSRKIYPYHIFMMVIYCILIDMYLYTIQNTEVKDIIMLVNLKT